MLTRPRLQATVALLAYSALAVLVFVQAWVDPARRWIGGGKDPRLFIWYLGWIPHELSRLQNPLFTDHLAYPHGTNLMWNTSMIFPALVLWPLTSGFGPVVAYNGLITAGVALSAWLGFLAARRFLERQLACFLAGLVYGFSPGLMAQAMGHPQVMVALFPPVALILGHEVLVRRRMRAAVAGALGGLAAFLQLLTGEELLATTLLLAALGAAMLALLHRGAIRAVLPYARRAATVAVVVFAVLSAYPLAFQFFGPQHVTGSVQPPDVYVSDLLAFVVPNHVLLQPSLAAQLVSHFTGNTTEDNAYVGLPLLVLFICGLVARWRRPAIRWAGLAAIGVAVLSLGPHLHIAGFTTPVPSPWAAFARLPLMESALPSRLMVTGFLAIGIVVAALWSPRLDTSRSWRFAAGAGLVAGLLAIAPPVPYASGQAAVPSFFTAGGGVANIPQGSVVLVTPFSSKESTDAMYWQTVAGYRFRMPEGDAFTPGPYLGPHPSYLQAVLDGLDGGGSITVTPDVRAMAQRDLASFGVRSIVAGPSPGEQAIVTFLTEVLGSAPDESGGVEVWWSVVSG
jgi:hypothetical protein